MTCVHFIKSVNLCGIPDLLSNTTRCLFLQEFKALASQSTNIMYYKRNQFFNRQPLPSTFNHFYRMWQQFWELFEHFKIQASLEFKAGMETLFSVTMTCTLPWSKTVTGFTVRFQKQIMDMVSARLRTYRVWFFPYHRIIQWIIE